MNRTKLLNIKEILKYDNVGKKYRWSDLLFELRFSKERDLQLFVIEFGEFEDECFEPLDIVEYWTLDAIVNSEFEEVE